MEEIITGISKHTDFIFVKIHFVSRDTQRLFQVERRLVKADLKKKEDKTTAISKQINFKMKEEIIGMTQCRILGKFEYTGGPIFKVVLEC